ncbi:hypothetical protein [Nocardia sp. NPDC050710]|uniref:hypothetical protein n=1 Tax=Nocardia sp. NPDC050710 TaxID=3157220 RepID=UPI0033F48838
MTSADRGSNSGSASARPPGRPPQPVGRTPSSSRREDPARLSAFIRKHIRLQGHYSFHLPDLGGAYRPLRDPDTPDEDD